MQKWGLPEEVRGAHTTTEVMGSAQKQEVPTEVGPPRETGRLRDQSSVFDHGLLTVNIKLKRVVNACIFISSFVNPVTLKGANNGIYHCVAGTIKLNINT